MINNYKSSTSINSGPSTTIQSRIDKAVADKNKRIDKAIEMRERSIAFFNSVNSAIEMAKANFSLKEGKDRKYTDMIIAWRDWFYSQWLEWHQGETEIQPITYEAVEDANEKFADRMRKDKTEEEVNDVLREAGQANEPEYDPTAEIEKRISNNTN